jgi:Domain of unknown function (DUF6969)
MIDHVMFPPIPDLPRALRSRREAAAVIRACRAARQGASLLSEALGDGAPLDWQHYPEGEVFDPRSHAQFFFHRHPPEAAADPVQSREYGHFHLFLGAEGMPQGTTPLLLPEHAVANVRIAPQAAPLKRGGRDEVAHLAAIAVDALGEPVRLFTTNQWVTGETWYRAEDVIAMVDRFAVAGEWPSALLNRWIGAMLCLFRPQIAALLQERDRSVMEWRQRRRTPVFEDPRLEIPSSLAIDLDAQLALAERAPAEAARTVPKRAVPRLPPMAEGWGEN